MSSEKSMYELHSKNKQKIMKNYNWEYFKSQINKSFQNQKQKNIYSQRKIDVEPVFGFMKAIFVSLGCLSEDSIKSKENLVLY